MFILLFSLLRFHKCRNRGHLQTIQYRFTNLLTLGLDDNITSRKNT